MTAGRREVDLDLLADYAGGALDGTPERERVARLVETDPAWGAALDELRTAETLVHADLATLARTPETIPGDVAGRLHGALADTGADAAPVVPLDRRRRRYRLAAAAAVAAGVVSIAGYAGYAVLGPAGPSGSSSVSREAGESAAETADRPARAGTGTAEGEDAQKRFRGYPVPVSASGYDYTREDLSSVRERGEVGAADAPLRPPRQLDRLATPATLDDCLTGVRGAHPGTVTKVDFARFEGAPALVVAIRGTAGAERVVVVGPDCRSADPDERYSTTG